MTILILYWYQYSQLNDSLSLFQCVSGRNGKCYMKKFPYIVRDLRDPNYSKIFALGKIKNQKIKI